MTQQSNSDVRSWKSSLLSTAVMGLVVLVPLAILFLVAMEVYGLLDDMANFADLAFSRSACASNAVAGSSS